MKVHLVVAHPEMMAEMERRVLEHHGIAGRNLKAEEENAS